ncbi:MAG: nucleotidyltransferase domain-containing protein, partial [Proteobacteria bacterium]|nr:nucleotidyltransferase domain-containing protein [Pseudomonadota bacterium]
MATTHPKRTGKRTRDRRGRRVPKELLDSVVGYFNPRRVIMFGSAARGAAGPDSDIDLLVVVDDDMPAERLGWRALWEARRGIAGAVDLIPCRETVFRERADIVGSLPWIASTEGVVVYERAEAD